MGLRKPPESVLCFGVDKVDRTKIRRYYDAWRRQHGIPLRCDNEVCRFHTQPLIWNGKPLKLTLDHKSGNAHDNSPGNLWLLCPNCDSQQPTRGGGNIGRIQNQGDGVYQVADRDGGLSTKMFQTGASVTVSTGLTQVEVEADS